MSLDPARFGLSTKCFQRLASAPYLLSLILLHNIIYTNVDLLFLKHQKMIVCLFKMLIVRMNQNYLTPLYFKQSLSQAFKRHKIPYFLKDLS